MSVKDYDSGAVEAKWQRRWAEARIFEAAASDNPKKWFGNVPYPYMSGFLHLGFLVTFLRAEIQARYRRMRGYNVLFPQAFHCTGLPILGAAKRIAEGEPIQHRILRDMGVPADEIKKFADPLHWIEIFPRETLRDLQRVGAAVDWRRTFITTHLNPPYDAFVRWQFRKLKEGGYVRRGKHPVIWCPKDKVPIGDHDRLEGEGEVPVEFTLLKFHLDSGKFLVAATLRPETVFGQTNVWIDPDVKYVEARVGSEETWILNRESATKLLEQGRVVKILGEVAGRSLLGRGVRAPEIHTQILVLPSHFIDQGRGTGVVTSVPSDAPDDWAALRDLQSDEGAMRSYGLDPSVVKSIRPIAIISSKGWGPLPAVEICERLGIRSQHDRELLEKAKEEIYRTGYYTGVMNESCGEFSGLRVEEAKERIREKLLASGEADTLYEPSGEVKCRCTTRALVKVVEDQWFLAYEDTQWKARVHEAIDRMKFYPEASRKQFHNVVDWLREWACAHHQGLGTSLPWDEHWVIESLSDSTIYMAYYTIAHVLQAGELRNTADWTRKLDDRFFDFVFLGKGDVHALANALGWSPEMFEELRREFVYWYPFDLRNSGKDLIQNHLTFCLFNHVALFPPRSWPKGFGVNGFVQMSGKKMSKSRGNVRYIRHALDVWGADATRFTAANGGDGLDDPNFDFETADSMVRRLPKWYRYAVSHHRTRKKWTRVDDWFLSVLNRAIVSTTHHMEQMNHRSALRVCYFDLQAKWARYLRRAGSPHERVLKRFLETRILLMAPFTPHVCEEVWEGLGKQGFVSTASWPECAEEELNPEAEAAEDLVDRVAYDLREILRVTELKPNRVILYVAPEWMDEAYAETAHQLMKGEVQMNELMSKLLAQDKFKPHAKELASLVRRAIDDVRRAGPDEAAKPPSYADEFLVLSDALGFFSREFKCRFEAHRTDEVGLYDPKGRAKLALPGRPAIYVE